MNTKCNTVATNLQQVKAAILSQPVKSPVAIYNDCVQLYTSENPLTPAIAHTIIVYIQLWQQQKITIEVFNKNVLEFNNKHGLYIPKKEPVHVNNNLSKEYSYINLATIDRSTHRQTMVNFESYTQNYNLKMVFLNKKVKKYNEVTVIPEEDLTEKELQLKATFALKHKKEFTKVYNKFVDIANEDKPIHKKKNYLTIKEQATGIFRICVDFYISQLRRFNTEHQKLGNSSRFEKKLQPELTLNHKSILDYEINGVKQTKLKRGAIYNQVKRLLEAEVIKDWTFKGYQRPIQCKFNPEIFIIKDGNFPKSKKAENQNIIPQSVQSLVVYNQPNIIKYINKEKKKSDEKNHPSLNSYSMLQSLAKTKQTTAAQGYLNTTEEENSGGNKKIKSQVGGENLNKTTVFSTKPTTSKTISTNARLRLMNDKKLANEMIDGIYISYTPLRASYLSKILREGDLDIDEISELLAQDFIKSCGKIYRNRKEIFEGEWINAKRMMQQRFAKGITSIYQKEKPNYNLNHKIYDILAQVEFYRGMLETARMIIVKNNNWVHYPTKWLNPARVHQIQMSFFGLKNIYLQKLRKKAERIGKKAGEIKENSKENKKISNAIRLDNALVKFAKGHYNAEQLFNYVLKNQPEKFDEIANMINLNAINRC
jgi:hypothetical protein